MLEKRLNSVESDITFEVINTGKQGWNTKDELNFLKSEGIKYSPDLIILGYVFNDAEEVSYNPIKFNMPEKESIFDKLYFFLYQNTYTLCIIKDHPMRYGKLFTKIKYNPLFLRLNLIKPGFSSFNYTNHTFKAYSEDSLEKNRELLEELIKFSRENDMEVLIQIFPAAIGDTKEDNKFFLLHDFIKKIARDNKVHVIDLINYFEVEIKKGHKLSVNAIDGHPNERAHWITSEVLYRKLVKEKLVPVE
jgi:hypothetical protein